MKKNSRFVNKRQFPRDFKNWALLPRDQGHSKFQKVIFDPSSLKVPSFIYLCLLVEELQRIKMKALQNFEDFCIIKWMNLNECFEAFLLVTIYGPEAAVQQRKLQNNASCSSSKKLQETPRKENIIYLKCIWNEIFDNDFIGPFKSAFRDKTIAVYRLLISGLDPKLWRSEVVRIMNFRIKKWREIGHKINKNWSNLWRHNVYMSNRWQFKWL